MRKYTQWIYFRIHKRSSHISTYVSICITLWTFSIAWYMYGGGCLVTTLHTFMKMYLFYHGNVGKILYVFLFLLFLFSFFFGGMCVDVYSIVTSIESKWTYATYTNKCNIEMVKILHKMLIKSFNYVFLSFHTFFIIYLSS